MVIKFKVYYFLQCFFFEMTRKTAYMVWGACHPGGGGDAFAYFDPFPPPSFKLHFLIDKFLIFFDLFIK